MLAKMCRENGKYVVEFKLMQELALESVLFFSRCALVWIIIRVKSPCQDQLWEVKWKI